MPLRDTLAEIESAAQARRADWDRLESRVHEQARALSEAATKARVHARTELGRDLQLRPDRERDGETVYTLAVDARGRIWIDTSHAGSPPRTWREVWPSVGKRIPRHVLALMLETDAIDALARALLTAAKAAARRRSDDGQRD